MLVLSLARSPNDRVISHLYQLQAQGLQYWASLPKPPDKNNSGQGRGKAKHRVLYMGTDKQYMLIIQAKLNFPASVSRAEF